MGAKKGRKVRKIEIPTDTPPEFELGDTVADIQWRREERVAKEREEEAQKKGGSQEGANYTLSRVGSCGKAYKDREK